MHHGQRAAGRFVKGDFRDWPFDAAHHGRSRGALREMARRPVPFTALRLTDTVYWWLVVGSLAWTPAPRG
jgi:hypothetical protein